MILKAIKDIFTPKKVNRIIVDFDLAFSDEEFENRKDKLSKQTTRKIRENFSQIVEKVISLSAESDKIYVECLGTAGEHFVLTLRYRQ